MSVDFAPKSGHRALAGHGYEVALAIGRRSLDERHAKNGQGDQLQHRDVPADEDTVHDWLHQPSHGTAETTGPERAERAGTDGPQMRPEVRNEPKEDPIPRLHVRRRRESLSGLTPTRPPRTQKQHISMRENRLAPAITHRPCQTRIASSSFGS